MQNLARVGLMVCLDTDISVTGQVTRISGTTVWVNNEKSRFSLHRWNII